MRYHLQIVQRGRAASLTGGFRGSPASPVLALAAALGSSGFGPQAVSDGRGRLRKTGQVDLPYEKSKNHPCLSDFRASRPPLPHSASGRRSTSRIELLIQDTATTENVLVWRYHSCRPARL